NRPFLLYQIDLLKRAGITDITLSLSYQPGRIEEILGNGEEFGVSLQYTVEVSPLGTAGAYRKAGEKLSESVIVLNGDTLTSLDLADVIACHREKTASATIVLAPVDNPTPYGLVETEPNGRVRGFREKPRPDEIRGNTINAGIYILEPHVLSLVPEDQPFSFEYQLFPLLLERNEAFFAYVWYGYWLDIGTPSRYLQANLDVLDERLNGHQVDLAGSAQSRDEGERTRIDDVSIIHPSCTIRAGAEIKRSVLGPNCLVEERARIEDSVLWAGSRVGPSSLVRNSVVGRSGIVGRNAAVENAILGDKSSLTDYTTV
ncbi:MAG: NDP-sugar synthase, partial [Acidobacteriota bacterium]